MERVVQQNNPNSTSTHYDTRVCVLPIKAQHGLKPLQQVQHLVERLKPEPVGAAHD